MAFFQLIDGQLDYQILVSNIEGLTSAKIHLAPEGLNGGAVVHLFDSAPQDVHGLLGQGTIVYAANSVDANSAIVDAVWIKFSNNEWMEGGWQKGSPMAPCSDTTANFYWYETIGTTGSECIGNTSGSTVQVKITDSDVNDTYKLYVSGALETTVTETRDAFTMQTGGESTDEDNSLDGGEITGLVYYNVSGTPTWWGSASLTYSNHMHSYTDTRTSPYTDYQ